MRLRQMENQRRHKLAPNQVRYLELRRTCRPNKPSEIFHCNHRRAMSIRSERCCIICSRANRPIEERDLPSLRRSSGVHRNPYRPSLERSECHRKSSWRYVKRPCSAMQRSESREHSESRRIFANGWMDPHRPIHNLMTCTLGTPIRISQVPTRRSMRPAAP